MQETDGDPDVTENTGEFGFRFVAKWTGHAFHSLVGQFALPDAAEPPGPTFPVRNSHCV
jgi:hypothetical protein